MPTKIKKPPGPKTEPTVRMVHEPPSGDETPYSTAADWPAPITTCSTCGQPAPEPLKVTTVEEYKRLYAKPGPKAVTLPSGAIFTVERPAVHWLAMTRRLRPEIMAIVADKGADLLSGAVGLEPDEWATFVDYLVSLSVVDPPVSFDEGVEGRIWVKTLSTDDKRAILEAVELEA